MAKITALIEQSSVKIMKKALPRVAPLLAMS